MRQLTRVAIGLGSSLGDREGYLRSAFERLSEDLLVDPRLSSFYESAPWGGVAKNAFLNAVAVGETDWKPPAILNYLKQVERDLGRQERERYADREIDLDILAWGENIWDGDGIEVPHPRLEERAFVIVPLAEVWPDWTNPKTGNLTREVAQSMAEKPTKSS